MSIAKDWLSSAKDDLILIENILDKYNIEYEIEKRFNDCKFKKPLPFDFYLPKYNTCIEYDGEQHFRTFELWGGNKTLELQQIKDQIKTDYCVANNIKLIRIKYCDNTIDTLKGIIWPL